MTKRTTRRKLLTQSAQLAGAIGIGVPLLGAGRLTEDSLSRGEKLRIVIAGAHPDDPETGCGGTIARYADLGHNVVVLYLTRGERGIPGKTYEEAGVIRTAEARKACQILKADPVFAGQVNGKVEVTYRRYDEYREILEAQHPDIVVTHWPIDSHEDHRATSLLVFDAWLKTHKKFALYYFEVMSGIQTSQFSPTHYVDITETEARKRAACFAHASQQPAEFYSVHDRMNSFRGMEFGCKYAEAFVRHAQNGDMPFPLLSRGMA